MVHNGSDKGYFWIMVHTPLVRDCQYLPDPPPPLCQQLSNSFNPVPPLVDKIIGERSLI